MYRIIKFIPPKIPSLIPKDGGRITGQRWTTSIKWETNPFVSAEMHLNLRRNVFDIYNVQAHEFKHLLAKSLLLNLIYLRGLKAFQQMRTENRVSDIDRACYPIVDDLLDIYGNYLGDIHE